MEQFTKTVHVYTVHHSFRPQNKINLPFTLDIWFMLSTIKRRSGLCYVCFSFCCSIITKRKVHKNANLNALNKLYSQTEDVVVYATSKLKPAFQSMNGSELNWIKSSLCASASQMRLQSRLWRHELPSEKTIANNL